MATNSYVRVPPDGAGKRINTITNIVDSVSVETQVVHVADHDNPEQVQKVDAHGASLMTFYEGPPGLDPYGNLRVSSRELLAKYDFSLGNGDEHFSTELDGGAQCVQDPQYSVSILDGTTSATSSIARTTDHYHVHQPGSGQLVGINLFMNNSGIVNNVRKWGLFDADDGLYWELDGTELAVEIRHTTGGILDSSNVPRNEWNGDKLDGTGDSGMILDLTKNNYYWMDFGWPNHSVRFGVMGPDGLRIVCHTFYTANLTAYPYMTFATLPIRFENYNEAITTSACQMRVVSVAVYAEGRVSERYHKYADMANTTARAFTTNLPVLSVRANDKYPNTEIWNLGETIFQNLAIYSTAPAKIVLQKNTALSNPTWTLPGVSSLAGDIGATAVASGIELASYMVPSGVSNWFLEPYFETTRLGVHSNADDTLPIWSFVASSLTGGAGQMILALTYKEPI